MAITLDSDFIQLLLFVTYLAVCGLSVSLGYWLGVRKVVSAQVRMVDCVKDLVESGLKRFKEMNKEQSKNGE